MTRRHRRTFYAALAGLCYSFIASASTGQNWAFSVLLDGDKVGEHRFELTSSDRGQRRLTSHAEFKVKFLFINAYSYLHRATETWQAGCLESLEANTDDNGDKAAVDGRRRGDRFVVNSSEGQQELPDCVMSFAYWNPRILDQELLLNAQTGEYLPIDVSEPKAETFTTDRLSVAAHRYELTAGPLQLTLWYSADGQWLGLESDRNGKILRYEPL